MKSYDPIPKGRTDIRLGKHYTWDNIPLGEMFTVKNLLGNHLRIFSRCGSHPDDCWYNGLFMGDDYAVFKWTGTFWQQASRWTPFFKVAQRYLKRLSKEVS